MIDKSDTAPHQDELDRLQLEVDSLRRQLQHAQRLAAVGTMAAMVAHEFNNILTPIVNYAQMARTNPKLAAKAIDKAADGGQRATHICNAILGITHEASPEAQVKLADLVSQTLAAMVRDPAKDSIDLRVDVPADLTVRVSPVELQQVLLNLLMNARAAVMTQTRDRVITISARRANGVEIRVSDNGPGIPPENLEKIFQPFFSTKSPTAADSGGHGLGLALCRQIATQLGGEISVSSKPGRGATFTVTLP